MNSSRIDQITVYTDVQHHEHVQLIEKYARRLCPEKTNIVSLTASPNSQTPFLNYWVNEAPRETTNLLTSTTFMNDFECFITGNQDLRSGEVIYALYQRQMPVLALHLEHLSDSNPTYNETGDEKKPSASTTNATLLQEVLYHERRRFPVTEDGCATETLEEAVQSFFDFPSQFGSMIAIESDRPSVLHPFSLPATPTRTSSPTASGNAHPHFHSCTQAIKEIICSYLRMGSEETNLSEADPNETKINARNDKLIGCLSPCSLCSIEKLIWLRSDGYPLSCVSNDKKRIIPPPLPLFHFLKDRLLPYSPNLPNPVNKGDLEAQLGPFYELLRQNPQLYSALSIFDRHGNRRMLRYLLQRGRTVILIDHMSTAFQALLRCLLAFANSDACADGDTPEQSVGSVEDAFYYYAKALLKFEMHWLELPTPSATLFLSHAADKHHVENGGKSNTISCDRWILNALTSYYDNCAKVQNTEHTTSLGLEVLMLSKDSAELRVQNVARHLQKYMEECIYNSSISKPFIPDRSS
ncbi:unnamed protein product [Phytomonas sp. EM1]|nr:unnamed protein product [Phytomonas sp. EM1]|eukprot:CCW59635.1 unnamed protein product [Phytomonas sp. isolate EM1]